MACFFFARLSHLISPNHDQEDGVENFARPLLYRMGSHWSFLEVQEVEPINNLAEHCASELAGINLSQANPSEKGNHRWTPLGFPGAVTKKSRHPL